MFDNKILNNYLDLHSHGVDPLLDVVERDTHITTLQPHMLSGKNQAVFLKMLAMSCNAKVVFELGTFTGYTALAFAEAVGEGGSIFTFECDEEMAFRAQLNFDKSNIGHRIKVVVGEAKLLLEDYFKTQLPDLIFVDADKESNKFYYDLALKYMKSGGVIVVDNILWKGRVLVDTYNDKKTISIKAFNDYVRSDDRVDACILPGRDGMYFIRKK